MQCKNWPPYYTTILQECKYTIKFPIILSILAEFIFLYGLNYTITVRESVVYALILGDSNHWLKILTTASAM